MSRHARRVDQHIDRGILLVQASDETIQPRAVHDVRRVDHDSLTFGRQRFECNTIPGDRVYPNAASRQFEDDRATDTTGCAGHDRNPPL